MLVAGWSRGGIGGVHLHFKTVVFDAFCSSDDSPARLSVNVLAIRNSTRVLSRWGQGDFADEIHMINLWTPTVTCFPVRKRTRSSVSRR